MNMVRVGEFAWSALEPAEGHYDLDWLARAVRLAEKHHIAVVIGTPTDTPPAWLTTKYPQVLRIGADGKQAEHGGRRQFSYSRARSTGPSVLRYRGPTGGALRPTIRT